MTSPGRKSLGLLVKHGGSRDRSQGPEKDIYIEEREIMPIRTAARCMLKCMTFQSGHGIRIKQKLTPFNFDK